jgi:predicted nucleic acid-binding protein
VIYLLDTNCIADLMRRQPAVVAKLDGVHAPNRAVVCSIVVGEVLFGVDRLPAGNRQTELRRQAFDLFKMISCEPVRFSAAHRFSEIKCMLEKAGKAQRDDDLWIAACALDLGATLVTRDFGFQQISGLPIEDWSV